MPGLEQMAPVRRLYFDEAPGWTVLLRKLL